MDGFSRMAGLSSGGRGHHQQAYTHAPRLDAQHCISHATHGSALCISASPNHYVRVAPTLWATAAQDAPGKTEHRSRLGMGHVRGRTCVYGTQSWPRNRYKHTAHCSKCGNTTPQATSQKADSPVTASCIKNDSRTAPPPPHKQTPCGYLASRVLAGRKLAATWPHRQVA